jgi:phosphatidylinositol-3-phosphatase
MAVTLVACGGSAGPPETQQAGPPQTGESLPRFSRVAIIVMENQEYEDVIGSPDAGFINALADTYGLATRFYAITHPSLPNYFALTSGSTAGIDSDCTDCHVTVPNVTDDLEEAGIPWKAYVEGFPSPCFTGAQEGRYTKRHNPFIYYDDIAQSPRRCSHIVPLTALSTDLASGRLPRFIWISPDVCHDTHDCPVEEGDRFLASLVPNLLERLGPKGVLFLTYDEGTSDAGCCEMAAGGHIVTVVAGPTVLPSYRSTVPYSHYSILRTIEDAWRLPELGEATCACTAVMSEFFSSSPAAQRP